MRRVRIRSRVRGHGLARDGGLEDKRATVPPKTPLGAALGYLHRQWKRLVLFLSDGNIELTNNRVERELRKLVLERRNWLAPSAARSSAPLTPHLPRLPEPRNYSDYAARGRVTVHTPPARKPGRSPTITE